MYQHTFVAPGFFGNVWPTLLVGFVVIMVVLGWAQVVTKKGKDVVDFLDIGKGAAMTIAVVMAGIFCFALTKESFRGILQVWHNWYGGNEPGLSHMFAVITIIATSVAAGTIVFYAMFAGELAHIAVWCVTTPEGRKRAKKMRVQNRREKVTQQRERAAESQTNFAPHVYRKS